MVGMAKADMPSSLARATKSAGLPNHQGWNMQNGHKGGQGHSVFLRCFCLFYGVES